MIWLLKNLWFRDLVNQESVIWLLWSVGACNLDVKIDVAAEKSRVRNQAMDFDYVEAEFVEADFEAEFAAESAGSCSPLHVCSPSKHSKWDCNGIKNCQNQNNGEKKSSNLHWYKNEFYMVCLNKWKRTRKSLMRIWKLMMTKCQVRRILEHLQQLSWDDRICHLGYWTVLIWP